MVGYAWAAAAGTPTLAGAHSQLLWVLAAGALALLLGRRRLASGLLYPAVLAFLLIGILPVASG
jgi:MFS superfamily sulfate permease-like transporter